MRSRPSVDVVAAFLTTCPRLMALDVSAPHLVLAAGAGGDEKDDFDLTAVARGVGRLEKLRLVGSVLDLEVESRTVMREGEGMGLLFLSLTLPSSTSSTSRQIYPMAEIVCPLNMLGFLLEDLECAGRANRFARPCGGE
ncbi:hypothetical protein BDK51DRAFT_52614 [Blyttiomyces helicus]|uniref:Uncharacterized protein n=1 Tax=Blyttiomyces helicus TaxID=388810 RepID=A0A4V1IRM0_9FUNG|nr:hypothetical protein BDK51DRAFT_52614 [Blyttiomyces helicus]|eukprot:RKO90527.1 hypothetical protein BDK51DRAFT_52614 [Blyttiomyces helicus]